MDRDAIFSLGLKKTERVILAKLAERAGRSLGDQLRHLLHREAQAAGLLTELPPPTRRGRPRKVAA